MNAKIKNLTALFIALLFATIPLIAQNQPDENFNSRQENYFQDDDYYDYSESAEQEDFYEQGEQFNQSHEFNQNRKNMKKKQAPNRNPNNSSSNRQHNPNRNPNNHGSNNGQNPNVMQNSKNYPMHGPFGDWEFRSMNKKIDFDFERNGKLEINVENGFISEIDWVGRWTADESVITFSVRAKKTEDKSRGREREMREPVDEVWKISYRVEGNKLILESKDFPKEIGRKITLRRDH